MKCKVCHVESLVRHDPIQRAKQNSFVDHYLVQRMKCHNHLQWWDVKLEIGLDYEGAMFAKYDP